MVFDNEIFLDAADIEPMITYGTNPGMGIGVNEKIPTVDTVNDTDKSGLSKSLSYMGLEQGKPIRGQKVDFVFIGSCTNSRIEDLRMVASFVKGRKKAEDVQVWVVPGSKQVEKQAASERDSLALDSMFFQKALEIHPGNVYAQKNLLKLLCVYI